MSICSRCLCSQLNRAFAREAGVIGIPFRRVADAKVMKDPHLANMMDPRAMPFDGKRMIYGGFKVMIDL